MHIELPKIYPVTSHTDNVGPGTTFVAIPGTKDDGSHYISLALQRGATTIVIEQNVTLEDEVLAMISLSGARVEIVENCRKELAQRIAQALDYPAKKLKIIGVTGTKGKTSTSYMIHHLLAQQGKKVALISTAEKLIGSTIVTLDLTTPLPEHLHMFFDLCVKNNVEYVVMEVSAQSLTLHRVEGLEFEAGAFTNFSLEHLEFYATMQEYLDAKLQFFSMVKQPKNMFVNFDDPSGYQILRNLKKELTQPALRSGNREGVGPDAIFEKQNSDLVSSIQSNFRTPTVSVEALAKSEVFEENVGCDIIKSKQNLYSSYSLEDKHATWYAWTTLQQGSLQLTIKNEEKIYQIHANLVGKFNAYNLLVASLIVHSLGFSFDAIAQASHSLPQIPGRMERYALKNEATCFIDYAHNPSSYEAVLSTLRQMTSDLIVVFGAGGARDKSKRPMMGAIVEKYCDLAIVTSDNPRNESAADIADNIVAGFTGMQNFKHMRELNRTKAIEMAYALSKAGTVIAVLGKGRDEYQIVGSLTFPFKERAIMRPFMKEEALYKSL